MEISCSKNIANTEMFGQTYLCGIMTNTKFLSEQVKTKIAYKDNQTTKAFFRFEKIRHKDLFNNIWIDLELNETIEKMKICELSSSELIRILILKYFISKNKVMYLEYIDPYLTPRDLKNIFTVFRKYRKETNKQIFFISNNIDNVVEYCDEYAIIENNQIIYEGHDLKELPIKTELIKFSDLANKKNAKLAYYKDQNDLLKAIYRSVKK